MSESGLVSIIMPSYNTGKYIAETINSVLEQTYKNWELLIVDDDSKDNTDEVIKPYLSDKRVRLIKNSKNRGGSNFKKLCIKRSKGQMDCIS